MELLNDSKYFDPPNLHEEDGCEMCHQYHIEEHLFEPSCELCQEEITCKICNGIGWVVGDKSEVECLRCQGSGRVRK